MQRAPDQTKAQTHQVPHVVSRHPMPHGPRWPGLAKARSQDVVSKAVRTATSVPQRWGNPDSCIRNHHRRSGPAPRGEPPPKRWRDFPNRKGTPHITPFPRGWASNTGRPCGKKPSRTLAGPLKRQRQVKSQGGNAATSRTVQSGEQWIAAITTAKTPEAAATPSVRPQITGHESSGTGKASHAGKPEPSSRRHITKGTRTNQRISVPRRCAGPLPRPAVVRAARFWVVGQTFWNWRGSSQPRAADQYLDAFSRIQSKYITPSEVAERPDELQRSSPRSSFHRAGAVGTPPVGQGLGRSHIISIVAPNATSLRTASTTARLPPVTSCTPAPSGPSKGWILAFTKHRTQDADVSLWNRIGVSHCKPLVTPAAAASPANRRPSRGPMERTTIHGPVRRDFYIGSNSLRRSRRRLEAP